LSARHRFAKKLGSRRDKSGNTLRAVRCDREMPRAGRSAAETLLAGGEQAGARAILERHLSTLDEESSRDE
jgi:hypothetical protein